MNIGDVAECTGLPAKTIRYYEDIGLVRPARTHNGYRSFDESDAHKLTFLARARNLGFSIEDCRQLLNLYEDGERSSADVRQIAEAHLRGIDDRIAGLTAMRTTLGHLVKTCHGDMRPDCPILDDLSGKEKAVGD